MRQDSSIDYSYHYLPLADALKKVHDALLSRKNDDALEALNEVIFQARATRVAVISMKESNNAIRQ